MSVSSVKDSSLIKLTVSLSDREMAYRIARSIIDNYISVARELNKDENAYLFEFVESQLPTVEKELAEIENKLLTFQKTKSILPSEELNALIKKFYDLNMSIVEAQLNYQKLQSQLNVLKQNISQLKGMIKVLEYVPDSPKLRELRSRLLELQINYNTLALKYTETSPEMAQIEQQMNIVQNMINEEISRILSSEFETEDPILREYYLQLINLQTSIEVTNSYLLSLESVRKQLENELQKFPDIQIEYAKLMRDYNLKQQTYTLLRTKREELRLSTAGLGFNVPIVLDEPYLPEKPVKPNKRLVLAIGLVLGIFLGLLAVFIREFFDEKVRDEYDVLNITGEEPFVYEPSGDQKDSLETLKHIVAEAFNPDSAESFQTRLLLSSSNSSWKIPVIEGLIELFSKLGKKITLVNLDSNLNFSFEPKNVNVVSLDGNLSPIFSNELNSTLKDLSQKNSVVILSGPAFTSADTKVLSSHATQTVLVLKASESKKTDLLYAMKNLKNPKFLLLKGKPKSRETHR